MKTQFSQRRSRRQSGFTLLELLVVFVLLALLAAIVGPAVMDQVDPASGKAAKVQIENLGASVDLYRLETGKYPEDLEDLVSKPAGVEGWSGSYLKKPKLPKDPWGNDYIYSYPGEHGKYDIVSYGADGRPGGEETNADIVSWE